MAKTKKRPVPGDMKKKAGITPASQLTRMNKAEELMLEEEIKTKALKDAIAALTPRQQRILALRFYEGKTQMDVSAEIGISQAQVSRLEKSAIKTIKSSLV